MSTEPVVNDEPPQSVAQMESLPGTPDGNLCEVARAHTSTHAESRPLFTAEEARVLASLDFDLTDRVSWPAAMRSMCDQDGLGSFEAIGGDVDLRGELLTRMVFATIGPEWAYACSLATALLEHSKDAELVHDLAFTLDAHNGTLVLATIQACSELMPKIAARMPERTPRELMRGILAEAAA